MIYRTLSSQNTRSKKITPEREILVLLSLFIHMLSIWATNKILRAQTGP